MPKLGPEIGFLPPEKIKLQLFPIDESTQIGLEKDGYNPFLELTLPARKKISSVLKHLNSKWGSSSVAVGQPVLFPYNVLLENLTTSKRWTLSSGISADDVYAAIERPSVFRLRYGWSSNTEPRTSAAPSGGSLLAACFQSEGLQRGCSIISESIDDRYKNLGAASEISKPKKMISKAADSVLSTNMSEELAVDRVDDEVKIGNDLPQSIVPWDNNFTNFSIGGLLSDASLLGKISNCDSRLKGGKSNLQPIQIVSSDVSIGDLLSEASLQGKIGNNEPKSDGSKLILQSTMDKGLFKSSVAWDNSLTTLSIGNLLSEASLQGKIDSFDQKSNGSKLGSQPTPLISESLDAFIARNLNSQPQASKASLHVSPSSILDAEETCHAFPRQRFSSPSKAGVPLSSVTLMDYTQFGSSKSSKISNFSELNSQGESAQESPRQESMTGLLTHLGVNNDGSRHGLAGIKWTESLGPFDTGALSPSRVNTSGDSTSISEFVR
ncbi:TSL-kinase interacting protein 1 isoform X2 [Diospyros lotus]|nr:TSL-kinase interacting protein 1 isoform X2 [Diospyros lotus]